MAKTPLLALDLGTTKFCLAKPVWDQDSINKQELTSIEIVSVPAKGMRRGMLSDFEEAKVALNGLLEKAEKHFDQNIHSVSVGIAGSHLTSRLVTHEFNFTKEKIYTHHLEQDLEMKFLLECSGLENKSILHALPISFKLDGREWIKDPKGFSFKVIKIHFLVIEADTNYLKDVVRLCNQSGLNIEKLIAEPYASSAILACEKSKNRGVAICDIGGGTVDGIIFLQGLPVHVFTINIGGRLFTNDLCLGLGISEESAEDLKSKLDLNKVFDQKYIASLKPNEFMPLKILGSRALELGKLLKSELSLYEQRLVDGLILTGGGSDLCGLSTLLSKILSKPVEVLNPLLNKNIAQNNLSDPSQENLSFSSKYATVCGLLYLELKRKHVVFQESKSFISSFKNNFFRWAKELA